MQSFVTSKHPGMEGGFVLIVFSLIFTASSGQQEQVSMTLMDLQHFESEISGSNNRYLCYLSVPHEDAAVSSLRWGNTRENDRNPDPPAAENQPNNNFPHWRVLFPDASVNSNDAFGVFGCEATTDGKPNTRVPTIRMRSDAEVLPTNGLVTQTVSVGDEEVTIMMQNHSTKASGSIRWRKDTVVVDQANGQLEYRINNTITMSDAGIYECYINGERNKAKHALHLLIVRGCRAYTWGPPDCLGICDNCYNGGVCDENNGKCICPAGFMGQNCQTACGNANGFGDNCEDKCSSKAGNDNACRTNLLCRPHPAGCRCIPGYEGLGCDEECTAGTFGASCLQTCHCESVGMCDRYSGVCRGNCSPGYTGENCQECQGATFQVGDVCTGECHCGESSCHKLSGLCSGNCGGQWADLFPPYKCQTGLTDVSFTKVNPRVTVRVNCSAVQGPGGDLNILDLVLSRQNPDLNDTDIVVTSDEKAGETRVKEFLVDKTNDGDTLHCQLRKNNSLEAVLSVNISFYALPVLQTSPNETDKTESTVTITWMAWNETTDRGDPPVIGYVPYYKRIVDTEWIADGEGYIDRLEFTFDGLSPDTNYSFSIAAVREGERGEGQRSPSTDVTTVCAVPDVTPTDVTVSFTGTHMDSVNVTWKLSSSDITCSTGVDHFTIYYSDMATNESKVVVSDSNARWFQIDELASEKFYTFKMTLTTSGGESESSVATNIPSTGTSAVVVVGFVIIPIGLIMVIGFVFWYRRKQVRDEPARTKNAAPITAVQNNAYVNEDPSSDITTEAPATKSDTVYEVVEKPAPIFITELENYITKCESGNASSFEAQFQLLDGGKLFSSDVGSKEEYQKNNRFKNIVAYDHSRVVLPTLEDVPNSDYYNANYIKDYDGDCVFIASQGPNTASIVNFWRMIWQENVTNIVMLTNLLEKGKVRCLQYWPDSLDKGKFFGSVYVHWTFTEKYADYEVRELEIRLQDKNEIRTVKNWHFQTWPDMGTPEQPTGLVGFTKKVKAVQESSSGPLTVHCSAGIGRTGTFIALCTLMDALHTTERIDVFGYVQKMRRDRIRMVQTAEQFKFLHHCLLEVYLAGDTDMSAQKFSSFTISDNQDKLNQQFQVLAKLDKISKKGHTLTLEEAEKCRFPSIVPVERRRPFLISQGKMSNSNYINACFTASYKKYNAYLGTQSPLPNTVEDFWRLVFDWKCPLIVMLNELDPSDETCCQYWPDIGTSVYGYMQVELKEEHDMAFYHYRVFDLKHAHSQKVLTVRHMQLKSWNNENPTNVTGLIRRMENLQNDHRMEHPTAVHCINGAGRTGVFLTAVSEISRMRTEQKVDVFSSVRQLRESNHNLVLTEEDYRLCHHILKADRPETEYGNI